jgi:hypothetical protein
MPTKDTAYSKALEVIRACVRPTGLYASGLKGGYEATWARDSMTTALGASFHPEFKEIIAKSIELLAKNQTETGLIPNCVGSYNTDRQSDVTFNSLDAPLWYIIGHYIYAVNYGDNSLLIKYRKSIDQALFWLKCQDQDNIGLVSQQPTGDWEDAFPHKYGYTIHCNALYYGALKMLGKDEDAEILQKIINGQYRKYSSLYNKETGIYFPWGWKNHDNIREHEEWFDTAGNLLAIVTGLATPKIANSILNYIEKEKINRPYPCKAIWPPIKKGDKEWHDYFELCDAREPLCYLNAGVWPFTGGFYVAALVKTGQLEKAEKELELLSEGVMKTLKIRDMKKPYEFNEWLHGKTGEAKGEPYQAWSAGTYVYASECVKRGRVLFF